MTRTTASLISLCLLGAPVFAGCGEEKADTTASAATAKTTRPSEQTLPAALRGTWKASIEPTELDDPPEDLEQAPDWELTLLPTGGENDGPSMVLDNPDFGTVVNPIAISSEQEFTIGFPLRCRIYAWAVSGDELSLKATESACGRETMRSVLEAKTWQRAQ